MMVRGAALCASLLAASAGAAEGNAEDGQRVFRRCAACHQVGSDAETRTGPVLNGIVGALAAGQVGFEYSPALLAMSEAGLVWAPDQLDAYLKNPRIFVAGTAMSFAGLAREKDRADVIAYLQSASPAVVDVFTVSDEVLAIEGDPAYGEYLAGECVACHSETAASATIPPINGRHIEDFVTALHAYREGARAHQVMQMVTGRLSDEEIAALAAYFGDLE